MDDLAGLTGQMENALRQFLGIFVVGGQRLVNNTKESFALMDATKWIRVIMIVGAYLLLRPHLVKLGARTQEKQYEKEHEAGKVSPNDLRGVKKEIPEASDDEDEVAAATQTTTEWGKKARKRQRVMLKKMIAAEEQRLQELQEDDEDKDIEQYLVG